jgi:hypothetical protein
MDVDVSRRAITGQFVRDTAYIGGSEVNEAELACKGLFVFRTIERRRVELTYIRRHP